MDNAKEHICHIMLYEFRKGNIGGAVMKDICGVNLDSASASADFNLEDERRYGMRFEYMK